jgi:ribosomal protein S27AE
LPPLPDGQEITVPAAGISGASIVSRKGLHGHDLMIQLDCKDGSDKKMRFVLNVNDEIIRGVMAGIDELVGEEKALRELEEASVTTETRACASCGASVPKQARFCMSCGKQK